MSILKINNVTMQFGGVTAVNNLNIEVQEGKIEALIGPNGAGKTTAFNVITGVYTPTKGNDSTRDGFHIRRLAVERNIEVITSLDTFRAMTYVKKKDINDDELEGVIAHELTHIRNKDVRLLIISIIFVGIISFVVEILFRNLIWGGGRRDKDDNKLVIVALIISAVAYFLSILFKFALSRKREYLADAGAVQLTRNSRALASALRKISGHSEVESVKSEDMKQMFIEHKALDGAGFAGLFATHPPIEKRIAVLEQM